MAVIIANTGSASWGGSGLANHLLGTGGSPVSWTLSYTAAEHDVTAFGVTQESSRIVGLTDWSGSIECQLGTPATGLTGSVTIPSGYATNIRSWSLSLARRVHEVTGIGASVRAYVGGVVDGSGTYEGYYDDNTAAVAPGTIASAVFKLDSTPERSFTANLVVTGPAINATVQGPNTISYNFVTNGAITANTQALGTEPIVPDGTTGTGWVDDGQTLTLLTKSSGTGQSFSGSAFWSGITINCPVDAPATFTVNFRGTGALTIG